MKKKILYLSFYFLTMQGIVKAQFETTDLGQMGQNATMIGQNAEIIHNAVEQFKQMKEIYQQGEASYNEFVQIKDFIASSEERLKNIGDIKQLRLNNIENILDKVFCIKQSNFFPKSIRFQEIVNKMKAGFFNCDNKDIYNKTYSGLIENLDARVNNSSNIGEKELNSRLNEFNLGMAEAEKTKEATSTYNSRMKLELGLKYKAISDELMKLSEEVHLAINQDKDSDKNIALTPAERLKMMDMANQYQMQALEYEEKSARLLKEASEADLEQQKALMKTKRDIAYKQMINFHL